MINYLVGRGSEKASQSDLLLIRIVGDIMKGNVGCQETVPHLGKGKSQQEKELLRKPLM